MIQTEFRFVVNERPWNRYRDRQAGKTVLEMLKPQYGVKIDDIVMAQQMFGGGMGLKGVADVVGSGFIPGMQFVKVKAEEEMPMMFSGLILETKYPGTWKTEVKVEHVDKKSKKLKTKNIMVPIKVDPKEVDVGESLIEKVKQAAQKAIEKVSQKVMEKCFLTTATEKQLDEWAVGYSMGALVQPTVCSICGEKWGKCAHSGVKK